MGVWGEIVQRVCERHPELPVIDIVDVVPVLIRVPVRLFHSGKDHNGSNNEFRPASSSTA